MLARPVNNKRELLSRHFFLRDFDVHTLDRIVQYSVVRTVSSLHWNVREVPILLQKSFCTTD